MTLLLQWALWLPIRLIAWVRIELAATQSRIEWERTKAGESRFRRKPENVRVWILSPVYYGTQYGDRNDLENVRKRLAEANLPPDERAALYAVALMRSLEAKRNAK